MNALIQRLFLSGCLILTSGCSAMGQSDSFTLSADLPVDFTYEATAAYVPAPGETCSVPGGKNTRIGINRKWQESYTRDSEIVLRRTVSGCPLVLQYVEFYINATYGKDWSEFARDFGKILVRDYLQDRDKGTFNATGESEVPGQCQLLFRTIGPKRYITKLLTCKSTDAQGKVTRGQPFAAYTLDQLPGKTVRLKIKLADEEEPGWGDTWVKVPGGWKRCMGKSFEDQRAYCNGNYTDFSTFRMPDGRICNIYPGCTENKEVSP
ncbi:hypothetical protein BLX41_13280 [Pseudomonas protegens]|uniref:hypothetical protein n=1 Tax=Pseudomonas protegens TaxID=380021 RepID=UPI000F4D1FE8|nr:hypothetical protein [Pseudomonas protegens]ROL77123.1 hypothetical protein BLX41_13280 [Pseudomonas protegens]